MRPLDILGGTRYNAGNPGNTCPGSRPEPAREPRKGGTSMTLENIFNKLEQDEPITTREAKIFDDEIVRGIDKLEGVMEDSTDAN